MSIRSMAVRLVGLALLGTTMAAVGGPATPNVWSTATPWYCYDSGHCYYYGGYVERDVWDPSMHTTVVDVNGWDNWYSMTGSCTILIENYFTSADNTNCSWVAEN